MGIEEKFLTGEQARELLLEMGAGSPAAYPEKFSYTLDAKEVTELNLALSKKLGRADEVDGFQFILDNELAEDFMYRSKHSKTFMSATTFKKLILGERKNGDV